MPLTSASALRKDKTSGIAPVMEHRHFACVAAIIASESHLPTRKHMAALFAARLRDTNPRFDTARFLAACEA